MKKFKLTLCLTLLAGLSLMLSACSKAQAQSSTASPGNRQLDKRMQLALGTLALEDTSNAVTAEQAAKLLPLWKAANSLTGADNVATEEMSGLFNQLEESMTSDQVQAIQSLDLAGQAISSLADKYGFQMGSGPANLTPEMQSTMEAARASGQMSQGGMTPPDAGGGSSLDFQGGPPPGAGGQGFMIQRSGGSNRSSSGTSATPTTGNPIFQAVITLLEGKIQSGS